MPKLQLDATQLKNTDVSFVSLVKHGANRVPFRIIKGETEAMLDLGKVGISLFKKADAPRGVVAVLVSKTADLAVIQPAMEKQGFVFTQKSEGEGGLVFAQPGFEQGPQDAILKLNADVALAVNGLAELPQKVKKEFAPWNADSTDFNAVLNTQGFFPGLCLAMDALQGTVYNIMKDAEDPTAAASMIESAIDGFKSYVMPCVTGIPVRAFKADTALGSIVTGMVDPLLGKQPGNQETPSGSGVGRGADGETAYDTEEDRVRAQKAGDKKPIPDGMIMVDGKLVPDPKAKTKKEESPVNADQGRTTTAATPGGEAPIGVQQNPEPSGIEGRQDPNRPTGHGGKMPIGGEPPKGTDATAETGPVEQNQGRGDVTVAGLMKGLQDAFTAEISSFRDQVLGGLTAVQKDVTGLGTRIEGVEGRIAKTEEAVNGTALGDAGGDAETRTQKSEQSGPPPLLDTAFNRRAAA